MKKIAILLALALALLTMVSALAEGDHSGVADASEMTDVVDVVEEGMEPVYAESLNDGTYEVAVDCSSSMFKIVGCALYGVSLIVLYNPEERRLPVPVPRHRRGGRRGRGGGPGGGRSR